MRVSPWIAPDRRYRLHVTVKSAKNLKDGNAKVYARVRAWSHKYYTPHVPRNQTAQGIEVYTFRQLAPFAFGDQEPFMEVRDDDEIEVYLWEDVLGPDTPLGHVEVPVAKLRGYKEAQGGWYDLSKDKKPAGQVYLSMHLELMSGGGGGAAAATPLATLVKREDLQTEYDHFQLSGQWRGFFWQQQSSLAVPDAIDPNDGDSVQVSEMELVFSQGESFPHPHQRISGTGSDTLGAWELRAGRRYTKPNGSSDSGYDRMDVEWVKTYTAIKPAFAQLDPSKLAQVETEAEADVDGTQMESLDSEALECVPEIFCEGNMDPQTSVISGSWHMAWRMTARCYKEPRFEGDTEPRKVWRGQHAYPAPISELMFQIRDPLAWDKRFEVVRLVEDKKLQREEGKRAEPLSDADWKGVVSSPTLDKTLYNPRKNQDPNDVMKRAIKKAKLLYAESSAAGAKVRFFPNHEYWQMVEVELPAVHVTGQFVLWQKGLPPHQVYPALSVPMPRVHLSTLVAGQKGGAAQAERAQALRGFDDTQRCLIIELGRIERLNNLATTPGLSPNLYLIAEVGNQRLLCQPLLGSSRKNGKEAPFDERFVVFLDGDAEHEAMNGKFELHLKLMHKQVEDEVYDEDEKGDEQRQSLGGCPYLPAALDEQMKELLEVSVAKKLERIAAEEELEAKRDKGFFGMIASWIDGASSWLTHATDEYRPDGPMPPEAPEDVHLASGKLDVTKDVMLDAQPREAKIDLTVPMEKLLLNRKVDETLAGIVKERMTKVFQGLRVDAIASLVQALGFADVDSLLTKLEPVQPEDVFPLLQVIASGCFWLLLVASGCS